MANWSKNQYRGNLGELDVTREFLHMGCAVNSLTASDAGWDLHVQVPEEVHPHEDLPTTWSLSGRTAHIQVKYTTKGAIPVNLSTLRGWVVGSKIGVPTFLFVVFESEGTSLIKYAPPWLLEERQASKQAEASIVDTEVTTPEPSEADAEECAPEDEIDLDSKVKKKSEPTRSFSLKNTLEWGPDQFGYLLQLWTRYPGFMLKAKIDSWKPGGNVALEAEKLVAKICWAWAWAHREPSSTDDEALHKMMMIALQAAKELEPQSQHHDVTANRLINYIEDARNALIVNLEEQRDKASAAGRIMEASNYESRISRKPWPQIEFATTYAISTDEEGALNEGLALVRDIAAYAQHLDSEPEDTDFNEPLFTETT